MSLLLQIEMLILALLFMIFIVRMVNRHSFSIKKALPWIIIGVGLIFISIFPKVVAVVAHYLGFGYTINFLLFSGLVFLFVLEINDTTETAKREHQLKTLIQEVSLLKKELHERDKNDE